RSNGSVATRSAASASRHLRSPPRAHQPPTADPPPPNRNALKGPPNERRILGRPRVSLLLGDRPLDGRRGRSEPRCPRDMATDQPQVQERAAGGLTVLRAADVH